MKHTFYVLQRDFYSGDVEISNFEAKDIDEAYEILQQKYATNNSQEWLFEENSFENLKKSFSTWNITPTKEEQEEILNEKDREVKDYSIAQIEEIQLEEARDKHFEEKEARADLSRKYDELEMD